MLSCFTVGIAIRNSKQMEEIYNFIMEQYPQAEGTKLHIPYTINFPLVRIRFFYLQPHNANRFDAIYVPNDITEEEKYEMLYPMIASRDFIYMKSYSDLYKKV